MTGRDHHDDEQVDPTGVRAILSALPDPGPMPSDVIERISASLAAERDLPTLTEVRSDILVDRRVAPAVDPHADAATLIRTEGRSPGAHRIGARLPALALAASIAVLAGVALLGALALTGRFPLGSLDAASGGDAGVTDSSDVGKAGQDAPAVAQEQAGDGDEGTSAASTGDQPMSVAATPVFASNTDLDAAGVAAHAAAVRARALDPHDNQLEGVPSASPVSSPAGAADCLGIVLDEDSVSVVTRLMAIDFVDYDGVGAAMVLLRDARPAPRSGDGRNEPVTAYLVPDDCGLSTPRTLTEPLRLDS